MTVNAKSESGHEELTARVRAVLSVSLSCVSHEDSMAHARAQLGLRRGTEAASLADEAVRAFFSEKGKSSDGHTWKYAGDDQSHGGRCYSHRQRCSACGASRRAYTDPDNAASDKPTRWYAKS